MAATPNNKSQVIFSMLLLLAMILLVIRGISVSQRGMGRVLGWNARLATDQIVTRIDAGSPADMAGLKKGDKIIGFEYLAGFEQDEQKDKLVKAFRSLDLSNKYHLRVKRGNEILEFDISSDYKGSYDLRYNTIQYHIIGIVMFILGVCILLLKPYDNPSMTFSAFLMCLSACYIPMLSGGLPMPLGILMDIIQYGCIFAPPYLLARFFLLFPEPIKQSRLRICLSVLNVLFALQAVAYLIPKHIDSYSPVLYNRNPRFHNVATQAFNLFYLAFVLAIVMGLVLLLVRFYRSNDKTNKLKVSWLLLGVVIGLPPLILLNGLGQFIGIVFSRNAAMITGFISLTFPITVGYAIVKHRVIDIKWGLRRSVKYFLMSRLIHAVEAAVLVVLTYFILLPKITSLGTNGNINTVIITTIIIYSITLSVVGIINKKIIQVIGRIFFREDYYTESLLVRLTQGMSNIRDQDALFDLVSRELISVIHIDKIAFFLPVNDLTAVAPDSGLKASSVSSVPRLVYWVYENQHISLNVGQSFGGHVPSGSWVKQINGGKAFPTEISCEDPSSWVYQIPEEVRNTLKEINSNIMVPFGQNGTTYGIISLGEKLSELPYSSNEINVLLSIATQITVVIDRIWLLREVSRQERLKHEIEIAQAVQTRLFPKSPMSNDGLEIIGDCLPARLVGGDYYDYIEHGDGKLGIAIGDAAGKGISGAMMMSSLRSSLRSIVLNEALHLSMVVYNLNNILCDSINPDKFVTFFYCVYDQVENTITYVNAGHDPPIILKGAVDQPGDTGKDNGLCDLDIIYADKHGVVLGVIEDYDYEQHTIHLSKGDIFLAYTDGIPEARNTLDEEYGADRLKAVVRKHASLPLGMIKSLILEDIRNFIGDREQQDDITLILAKV